MICFWKLFMKKLTCRGKGKNTMCRYKDWTVYKMLKGGGLFLVGMTMAAILASCGNQTKTSNTGGSGVMNETATDNSVDFGKLNAVNPDIFAWLYVPGTGIDYPISQNLEGDDSYYLTHDCTGMKEDKKGGIYTESYNLIDMCDFNTVIHGATTKDGDLFSELWNFSDEKYFKDHDKFMIILPDNVLTYEIWTAYQRDNTNVFMQYDFTEENGCRDYLDDMKKNWNVKTNFREGWEQGVDPDNFLVTLTTVDPKNPDKQWVVVGCMIGDAAGKINREASTEDDEMIYGMR